MAVTMDFEVEGDFTSSQIKQALFILGELIINKAKENIRAMNLVISGDYLQGWFAKVSGNNLSIENTKDYAVYLEYGTYSYWSTYGLENYPDPSHPKKKDLPREVAQQYPKGMQPYAPVRRVMFNEGIMTDLLSQAFSAV